VDRPATRSLADYLAALDPDALAELLSRRPDMLLGRPPATVGDLAERLGHPGSLIAAARTLTRPAFRCSRR
jgi:hypothetical protein